MHFGKCAPRPSRAHGIPGAGAPEERAPGCLGSDDPGGHLIRWHLSNNLRSIPRSTRISGFGRGYYQENAKSRRPSKRSSGNRTSPPDANSPANCIGLREKAHFLKSIHRKKGANPGNFPVAMKSKTTILQTSSPPGISRIPSNLTAPGHERGTLHSPARRLFCSTDFTSKPVRSRWPERCGLFFCPQNRQIPSDAIPQK